MYYNNLCVLKIFIEVMYTFFYLCYYHFISLFVSLECENNQQKIIFYCGYGNIPGEKSNWDGNTEKMGGSENSMILIAEKLSFQYKVVVYNNCLNNTKIRGVEYVNTKYFNFCKNYDTVIFWRFPFPLLFSFMNIKNKILWIHDGEPLCKCFEYFETGIVKYFICKSLNRINKIITPSDFMAKTLKDYYNKIQFKIYKIPNIIIKKELKINKKKKILWHINFNRGLQNIIERWDDILLLNEEFELHIYGCQDELYLKKIDYVCKKNIYFYPKISHKKLINLIPDYKYFLYPALIRESFSISTWECLVNGCIPIVYGLGALNEIDDYGGIVVDDFDTILTNLKYIESGNNYEKKIREINNYDFNFILEDKIVDEWSKIIKGMTSKDNYMNVVIPKERETYNQIKKETYNQIKKETYNQIKKEI